MLRVAVSKRRPPLCHRPQIACSEIAAARTHSPSSTPTSALGPSANRPPSKRASHTPVTLRVSRLMDFTEIYPQSSPSRLLQSRKPVSAHRKGRQAHRASRTHPADHRLWQVEQSPAPTSSEPPRITHIGWSCDTEFVLAACAKHAFVRVCQLRDETWSATIEAGVEGLVNAVWAPDGRHILCFSEWGLRLTVWSLVTGLATYIQYPNASDRGQHLLVISSKRI